MSYFLWLKVIFVPRSVFFCLCSLSPVRKQCSKLLPFLQVIPLFYMACVHTKRREKIWPISWSVFGFLALTCLHMSVNEWGWLFIASPLISPSLYLFLKFCTYITSSHFFVDWFICSLVNLYFEPANVCWHFICTSYWQFQSTRSSI